MLKISFIILSIINSFLLNPTLTYNQSLDSNLTVSQINQDLHFSEKIQLLTGKFKKHHIKNIEKNIKADRYYSKLSGENLQKSVDEYFDRLSRFGFSGNLIIGDRNGVIYYTAKGLANRESGKKITSNTVFTTGSITKLFTALLIIQLNSEAKLKLNDKISFYLPKVPKDKQEITIKHLLTHTSGLKRNGLEGGDTNLMATREAVLNNVLNSPPLFQPGTRQEYSNIGYTLLAMIAENITNINYERLLYEKILKPSGMFQTGYLIPNYKEIDLAKGYRNDKSIEAVINLPQLKDGLTWNIRGNGGLHSNLFDMYRFYLALDKGIIIDKNHLLQMFKKPIQSLNNNDYYGIGFNIATDKGLKDISHSGGNGYFSADFHWLIDENLMFYISTNEGSINMENLSNNVKKLLRNQRILMPPKILELDQDSLKQYQGTYIIDSGDSIEVEFNNENLQISADSEKGIEAIYGVVSNSSKKLAEKSKEILAEEFNGNFEPKYLAMNKSTSIDNLKKYHGYDASDWQKNFGDYQDIKVIAHTGSNEFSSVILKINFKNGAAAEVYTWKNGVLSNISVYPDWKKFKVVKDIYPISLTEFQSFDINSPLISTLKFDTENKDKGILTINGYKAKKENN